MNEHDRGTMKTRGVIIQNTLYNLAGSTLPLIVAVLTIPLLIRGFGKEKFGILSLAWVLIGYFSLADLGLSRTLTKFVSEKMGQGKKDEIPVLIWTALSIMTILGIIGACLLALLSPVVVHSVLKIEHTNTKEILNSFYILSVGIPFTIISTGLRGILEAMMRFDLSNYVRTALGIFNFLGPAFALLYSNDIIFAVIALVVGRIFCLGTYLLMCFKVLPEIRGNFVFNVPQVVPLLKFGGWITVSNLISPIMVSFDRFFLGALVSVSALAYYATPWEVMARILIIPTALSGVMFPVFSQMKGADNTHNPALYYRSLKYILLSMFPICLICASFAKEILLVWLGNDFALQSSRVMQIMAVGVLVNGLAMIPFCSIQAAGRPDMTAKFHILEVIMYVPILWLLIKEWGVVGAAIAWLIRVSVDLILLLYYSNKSILPKIANGRSSREYPIRLYLPIMVMLISLFALLNTFFIKVLMTTSVLIVYVIISWTKLLEPYDKELLAKKLRFDSD
jgi:O-antigen/teichoic acid export membrane protein